jgi:hypothetical protein
MDKRVRVTIPRDVLQMVRRIAPGTAPNEYVLAAVRERLQRDRWELLQSAAGAWKDHPEFPTDESVVEWVRGGREEVRDPEPE